jgi:hypothetical protein
MSIAGTPHLLGLANVDKATIHLIAIRFGVGLVCFVGWSRPKVTCAVTLDRWEQIVLHRATISAYMIWAGLYLYYLIACLVMLDIGLSLSHATPFITMVAFFSRKESWVWAGCLGAIAVTLVNPATASLTAVITSIVFELKARRLSQNELYVGGVIALYFACWTIGWQSWPLPETKLWLNVTTGVILLVMGWRMRLRLAFFIVVPGGIISLKRHGSTALSNGRS